MRKAYTTDLSDEQWALVEPLIPPQRPGGDKRTTDMREVVDAILYVTKNGCQWRDVPGDFAPDWHTAFAYFNAWSKDGTWERIYEALHRRWRKGQG
jgi:putative transposase